MSRLPLTLALTLALAGAAPALAKNQRNPDCSKVPGHPDCVYPTNPKGNHMPTAEQTGAPKTPSK
jgi:hypothetical protein